MDREIVTLFAPYVIGLLIPLGVGIYAFRHHDVNGASEFGWFAMTRSVWNLGLIFEMLSVTQKGKLFWHMAEMASSAVTIVFFVAFIIAYAELKLEHPRLTWVLLMSVPAVFLLLVVSNDLHNLVVGKVYMLANSLSPLQFEVTPVVWAYWSYCLVLILLFLGILIGKFYHAHSLYRSQASVIALGLFIGTSGVSLALALQHSAITPLASGISNLIVMWGLFYYRIFDLKPIARDALFENMTDFIVILDVQNRIADMNRRALQALKLTSAQTIGKQVESIFSQWPEIVEKFRQPGETSIEIYTKHNDSYFHFDVSTTLLHDKRGNYQGRVLIARDITTYAALQWKQMILNEELEKLNSDLEQRVRERTEELAQAYDTTLQGWANALELRDKETEGHSRRVTEMTLKLASALDVAEEELDDLRRGALLHDIGKMAIPDEILRKEGRLTPQERRIIAEHPVIAYKLLSPIKFLEKSLEIPYCHHERWNGKGYPRGLKEKEIPLSARIFSVVDVWDAIRSDRFYRKAWPVSKACTYMKNQSSRYFDPIIVNTFLDLVRQGRI